MLSTSRNKLNSNKANAFRLQWTVDTYTQTNALYLSYWADMYRIMTNVQLLPNANTLLGKGIALTIYAYAAHDPSYAFPISIFEDGTIRGLCPLNVQMYIGILWLL